MQHHLYTLNTNRQDWQISLVDETDLLGLALRGQIADEALIYNPETGNFTPAQEYANLMGRARGLRVGTCDYASLPAMSGGAKSQDSSSSPNVRKLPRLPRVPNQLRNTASVQTAAPPLPLLPVSPSAASEYFAPLAGAHTGSGSDTDAIFPQIADRAGYAAPESDYSRTDDAIASYVPRYQESIRLQIAGLVTLPVFGLGLPLLIEGWRRRNAILRLVEQTGMEKSVWLTYVGQHAANFRTEQKALRMAAAAVSLISATTAVYGLSRGDVRAGIVQFAGDFKPSAAKPTRRHMAAPENITFLQSASVKNVSGK